MNSKAWFVGRVRPWGLRELHEVTSGMRQEAARFGFYEYGRDCIPRVQLLTIAELLGGGRPWIPRAP